MPVATTDAFRRITVQPDNITVVAEQVGDTLTLVAGTGISLVANPTSDQITILNTNPAQFSLGVAGDDSSIKVINSGETIRFAGSGTVTVSADAEGKITITGSAGTVSQLTNGLEVVSLDSNGGLNLTNYGVIRNTNNSYVVNSVAESYVQMQWTTAAGVAEIDPNSTSEPTNWVYIHQNGFYVETNVNVGTTNQWLFGNNGSLSFPDATVQTTAWTGDIGEDITIGSIRINTNIIQTVDSNANLELKANGSGKVAIGGYQVSLGTNAGLTSQGTNGVAVGAQAGQSNQSQYGVSVGSQAGQNSQGDSSVAIGSSAGWTTQGSSAVAIGPFAGYNTQGTQTVAIGSSAASSNQGSYAVAIGGNAGQTTQGSNAISIGRLAGQTTQGSYGVAVGLSAGTSSQGQYAIAIGNSTGQTNQGLGSVAVGASSGLTDQGTYAVAVGALAANNYQSQYGVAIGYQAGNAFQGANAVAIGRQAGQTSQPANSIVINASGNQLDGSASGLFIDPIRQVAGGNFLTYNTSTKEITYTNTIGSININTNVIQTVDSNSDLELDASGTGSVQLRSRLKLSDGTSPDGIWTNFTPTWTAGTSNPSIGNGILEGTYKRVGNTVHVWIMMTAGSTTTFGSGEYKISLPVTARAISRAVLNLVMNNDGTRLYNSLAHNGYTTTLSLDSDNVTLFWDTGVVTHNSPFAWASGDWFIISGTYEAS